jgi:hypothetical protein
MLSGLRNARGGPAMKVRVLAGLVVLGLLTFSVPALFPVLRWAAGLLF